MKTERAVQLSCLRFAQPSKLCGGRAPGAWQRRLQRAASKAGFLQRWQARRPALNPASLSLCRLPLCGETLSEVVEAGSPQVREGAAASSQRPRRASEPQQAASATEAPWLPKDRKRPAPGQPQGEWGRGPAKAVPSVNPVTRLSPRADSGLLKRAAGKRPLPASELGRPKPRLPKVEKGPEKVRPVPKKAAFAAHLQKAAKRVLPWLEEGAPQLPHESSGWPSKADRPALPEPPGEGFKRPIQGPPAPGELLSRLTAVSKQPPLESPNAIEASPCHAIGESPPPSGDSPQAHSIGDSPQESPRHPIGDSPRENEKVPEPPGHSWKLPIQGPQAPGEMLSRLAAVSKQPRFESPNAIGDSAHEAAGDSPRQFGDSPRHALGQNPHPSGDSPHAHSIGDSPRRGWDSVGDSLRRSRPGESRPTGDSPRLERAPFEDGPRRSRPGRRLGKTLRPALGDRLEEEADLGAPAAARRPAAHFETPSGKPRRTDWAGTSGPPPADLEVLASQIQRILDEEARRHGIDV